MATDLTYTPVDEDLVRDDAARVIDEPVDLAGELRRTREAVETLAHLAIRQGEMPDETSVQVLNQNPILLRRNGRHYLEIFAATAIPNCQITTVSGVYTFTLPAGWSILNFLDGSPLTVTSGSQSIVLRATNYPVVASSELGGGVLTIVDPATGTTYQVRPANADGVSGTLVADVAALLWNGTTLDRPYEATGDGMGAVGMPAVGNMGYNAGGPGGGLWDRVANLQGKGQTTGTLNGAANSGQNQAILNAGAVPPVGAQVIFYGGTQESAYVKSVSGQTLTFTVNLVNTHNNGTNISWNTFASDGPGTSAMNPIDLMPNVMAIYSSGDGNYYLMRAFTIDNLSVNQVPAVGAGVFNGTNMDRMRSNIDTGALITAAGATTTQTTADQTNFNGRGIKVVLDMTTVGTGSVTLEIDGKDTASGKYYPILTGAAVTTNSTNVYSIGPGLPATANVSANDLLPRTWRIKVTANNANPTSYTVGGSVIW